MGVENSSHKTVGSCETELDHMSQSPKCVKAQTVPSGWSSRHEDSGVLKVYVHRAQATFPRVPSAKDWQETIQSVTKLFPTPCDPMDCSMPGSSLLRYLPELAQIYVHLVHDAIQPSHPPLPPSAFNLSLHQGLFQWVVSSHQVARVLELQY